MKDNKVKAYTMEELKQKIGTEKEGLQKMKFAHRISAIENPVKIKAARRFIAQLKTELRAKELQK